MQSYSTDLYWPNVAERTCYDSFNNLIKRVNQELDQLKISMDGYTQRIVSIREWQGNAMRYLMELKSFFTDKMDSAFNQCVEYIRSKGTLPDVRTFSYFHSLQK